MPNLFNSEHFTFVYLTEDISMYDKDKNLVASFFENDVGRVITDHLNNKDKSKVIVYSITDLNDYHYQVDKSKIRKLV